MRIVQDLTGQVFGRLTVLEKLPQLKNNQKMYRCLCICNKETEVAGSSLIRNSTKSCGCLKKEVDRLRDIKHGMTKTRTYRIWNHAKRRCLSPNNIDYADYGGRGIDIDPEWAESFEAFYRDMGEAPIGMSIDRINNSLGYCKNNCRWASQKEQARNTRRNRYIEFRGETRMLCEWADILGIKESFIRDRIDKLGWSVEDALSLPHKFVNQRITPSQVQEIIRLRESGLSFQTIAEKIGCSYTTVRRNYQKVR